MGLSLSFPNGVRSSLIPVLISFFQNRSIAVKWKGTFSNAISVAGGGAQGISAGILEYLSQTAGNLSFLPEDEAWKFMDDNSFVEIINLAVAGISSFNVRTVCHLTWLSENSSLTLITSRHRNT